MNLRTKAVQYCLALMALYLLISLLIPLSRETREAYNLSLTQAHIISFITILPLFGIWFVAFYAYGQLQKYATAIAQAREGKAFAKIADGVMILSWGLVIQSFASLVLGWVADQSDSFSSVAIVLQNYVTLLFPLIAFILISTGTQYLLRNKNVYRSLSASRLLVFTFAVTATIYSFLVFRLRQNAESDVYHLPLFLLITTLVIPYLFAWFSGMIAAFDITMHARITKGVLYKRSLNLLASGLIVIIVAFILIQYLNSVFMSRLGDFSINAVLLVDYILLLLLAMGYVILVGGVRGLQKIEEV